jgi:hypothetical protein
LYRGEERRGRGEGNEKEKCRLDIILLTKGFMDNSGMFRNSSVLMLPLSSLSSLLNLLYSLLISFGETVDELVGEGEGEGESRWKDGEMERRKEERREETREMEKRRGMEIRGEGRREGEKGMGKDYNEIQIAFQKFLQHVK